MIAIYRKLCPICGKQFTSKLIIEVEEMSNPLNITEIVLNARDYINHRFSAHLRICEVAEKILGIGRAR